MLIDVTGTDPIGQILHLHVVNDILPIAAHPPPLSMSIGKQPFHLSVCKIKDKQCIVESARDVIRQYDKSTETCRLHKFFPLLGVNRFETTDMMICL